MCDLYSMTTNQQAIRDLAKAMRDVAGNLPSLPGIFPDQLAPVVRTGTEGPRFTSLSESSRRPDGKSEPVWFALDESHSLAFFAGL